MARKDGLKALLGRLSTTAVAHGTARPQDNPAIHAISHVVGAIPRGEVWTYGAVARAAGLPGRARQAGFALRIAPKGMSLPWHRVLGAGGRIVFAKTSPEHREQAKRLRSEGVPVRDGRVPAERVQSGTEL